MCPTRLRNMPEDAGVRGEKGRKEGRLEGDEGSDGVGFSYRRNGSSCCLLNREMTQLNIECML